MVKVVDLLVPGKELRRLKLNMKKLMVIGSN